MSTSRTREKADKVTFTQTEVTSAITAGDAVAGARKLLRITRYTSAGSGTWTKPSDTVSVLIKTVAGGGGGGGGSNDSDEACGGGGGGGGYAEKFIAAAASSYAYVVGAGGSNGAAQASGSSGSATTIAGIAGGAGSGGSATGSSAFVNGGSATTPTGGDLNVYGGGGGSGYIKVAGLGGSSIFGNGAEAKPGNHGSSSNAYGAGGTGGGTGGGGSSECDPGESVDAGIDYEAGPSLTDNDGNTYETVVICDQTWTTTNLNVSSYRDGTPIPYISDFEEWKNSVTGSYTYAGQETGAGYGKLYNSWAIIGRHDLDPDTPDKELAPEGYHIPISQEWNELVTLYYEFGLNSPVTNSDDFVSVFLKSETSWDLSGNNESGLNLKKYPTIIYDRLEMGSNFSDITNTTYSFFATKSITSFNSSFLQLLGFRIDETTISTPDIFSRYDNPNGSSQDGVYVRLVKDEEDNGTGGGTGGGNGGSGRSGYIEIQEYS